MTAEDRLLVRAWVDATRWNRAHAPGARVAVRLDSGHEVTTTTATYARVQGVRAVISLRRIPMPWPLAAVRALDGGVQ